MGTTQQMRTRIAWGRDFYLRRTSKYSESVPKAILSAYILPLCLLIAAHILRTWWQTIGFAASTSGFSEAQASEFASSALAYTPTQYDCVDGQHCDPLFVDALDFQGLSSPPDFVAADGEYPTVLGYAGRDDYVVVDPFSHETKPNEDAAPWEAVATPNSDAGVVLAYHASSKRLKAFGIGQNQGASLVFELNGYSKPVFVEEIGAIFVANASHVLRARLSSGRVDWVAPLHHSVSPITLPLLHLRAKKLLVGATDAGSLFAIGLSDGSAAADTKQIDPATHGKISSLAHIHDKLFVGTEKSLLRFELLTESEDVLSSHRGGNYLRLKATHAVAWPSSHTFTLSAAPTSRSEVVAYSSDSPFVYAFDSNTMFSRFVNLNRLASTYMPKYVPSAIADRLPGSIVGVLLSPSVDNEGNFYFSLRERNGFVYSHNEIFRVLFHRATRRSDAIMKISPHLTTRKWYSKLGELSLKTSVNTLRLVPSSRPILTENGRAVVAADFESTWFGGKVVGCAVLSLDTSTGKVLYGTSSTHSPYDRRSLFSPIAQSDYARRVLASLMPIRIPGMSSSFSVLKEGASVVPTLDGSLLLIKDGRMERMRAKDPVLHLSSTLRSISQISARSSKTFFKRPYNWVPSFGAFRLDEEQIYTRARLASRRLGSLVSQAAAIESRLPSSAMSVENRGIIKTAISKAAHTNRDDVEAFVKSLHGIIDPALRLVFPQYA